MLATAEASRTTEREVSLPLLPRSRLALGAAASLLTLVALYRLLDLDSAAAAVAAVPRQPVPLLAAVFAYSAAFWLRAGAWSCLLTGAAVPTGRLFSILQACLFLNHLLPVKAGEVARPILLSGVGVPLARAAASSLVARLFDFVCLLAIALVVLPLSGGLSPVAAGLGGALLLAALLALGALVRLPLPRSLPAAVTSSALELREALGAIGPAAAARALPPTLLSWLLEGAVLLAAARLLGIEIGVGLAIGATAFTVFFQALQLTPGGLGLYETSMTSVLALHGVAPEEALLLAVVTHGLKFAYSFTVGLAFAVNELVGWLRAGAGVRPKRASRLEIVTARVWNVVNEGKPFTPLFALSLLVLLQLPQALEPRRWLELGVAMAALLPLAMLFFRFDFPLHLRAALWLYLAAFVLLTGFVDATALLAVTGVYLVFTVFVWGTLYYHLRIGTPWTNFLRFWRLVLENPDPTSGNLQEQLPKLLMLVFGARYLAGNLTAGALLNVEAFTLAVGLSALLLHQWFFTWVPALPQAARGRFQPSARRSSRVIVVAIDGCRADRLREARTPCIDALRQQGTEYTNVATVYPARTVTGFSSMLTGAPPRLHGMRSNFVPSLGVKCESVFDVLERAGLRGRLVGIAHLIDAFGEERVRSVTAVMHNDDIDAALVERAKLVLREEEPELLVLQLLSVDQTGHARGSYHDEYLRKIEATDRVIRGFLDWCREHGYLDGATLILTSDHGQGIGIGGHGHMTPSEIYVPCILWGEGVEAGRGVDELRFVTDVAATICERLGVAQPSESVGRPLLPPLSLQNETRPVVFVLPARNEAGRLPAVLAAIERCSVSPRRVVVVDDGSSDATGAVAQANGAIVVRHERPRGLGAALRSGLQEARELDARAAVYLDADGEYDAREAPLLLAPIEAGEADFVLGSRFIGSIEGMTLARRLANHAFSLLLSLCCGRRVSDGQTGFRAFSRRALDVAEIIHDYNYAQVLTLDLLRKGMRMAQAPVSYRRRQGGRSFVSAEYLWRVPAAMVREMLSD